MRTSKDSSSQNSNQKVKVLQESIQVVKDTPKLDISNVPKQVIVNTGEITEKDNLELTKLSSVSLSDTYCEIRNAIEENKIVVKNKGNLKNKPGKAVLWVVLGLILGLIILFAINVLRLKFSGRSSGITA